MTDQIDEKGADGAFERFEIPSDKGPEIVFQGVRLARVSSERNNSYRWTEIEVYRTRGGKIVLHMIGRTTFEDERDRHESTVLADEEALVRRLGFTKLSQKLYAKMGLRSVSVD